MNIKLNKKEIWTFNYRGITAEIVHWGKDEKRRPDGTWNYYLYIPLKQVIDKELAEKLIPPLKTVNWGGKDNKIYDSNIPVIDDLELHGGVTYCKPELSSDGSLVLKIGCDYSHYGDEDQQYNEFDLSFDARNSIDKLHELVKLSVFCHGDGRYCLEENGEYHDKENKNNFYSFDYLNEKVKKIENLQEQTVKNQ